MYIEGGMSYSFIRIRRGVDVPDEGITRIGFERNKERNVEQHSWSVLLENCLPLPCTSGVPGLRRYLGVFRT